MQDINLFTAIQKVIDSLLKMAGDVEEGDSEEEVRTCLGANATS